MLTKQQKLISENPFYGLKAMLDLFQEAPKMVTPDKRKVITLLSTAWNEVKAITDANRKLEATELFYSLIFAIGDVTNRDHAIFGKSKVEKGGMGSREAFRYSIEWMVENQSTTFYKIIHLIPEYSNYENLFFNQLRTDRYKGTVLSQDFLNIDYDKVALAMAKKAKNSKTTDFELGLIAKFLPKVPVAHRYKHTKSGELKVREKQAATLQKDMRALRLIEAFSNAMNFEIITYPSNIRYIGYEKWRSQYLKGTEAQMFSSKEITKLDKTQFEDFLTKLPAGARYRVQRRLLEKDKKTNSLKPLDKWKLDTGENMGAIFLQWEKDKVQAMEYLVSLSETEKDQMDVKDLKKLEKAAKVTTGGNTLYQVMIDFIKGNYTDGANLMAQSLVDKIKLEVPVLSIADVSASMAFSERMIQKDGAKFHPIDMARLATALFLYKNPDPDLQNFFMRFDDKLEVVQDGSVGIQKQSRFMQGKQIVVEKLCDPTKPFLKTYHNVVPQLFARGGTQFHIIADELKTWAEEEGGKYFSIRKEILQKYPVWLVTSDGDMNGAGNATQTMRNFQMKIKQYFAFEPVIVVWDVSNTDVSKDKSKFKDLENVMYFGGFNPQILNQVFLNINDIDIIDIYTPLRSLFLSNRYQPVRDAIAGRTKAKALANVSEDTIVI